MGFRRQTHAPAPTFAADITPAEAARMCEHGTHRRGLAGKGVAVVFGPLAAPSV